MAPARSSESVTECLIQLPLSGRYLELFKTAAQEDFDLTAEEVEAMLPIWRPRRCGCVLDTVLSPRRILVSVADAGGDRWIVTLVMGIGGTARIE